MVEASVQSLERLAEMHRRGDLSDAEFAEAKRGLLEPGADTPAAAHLTPAPDPLAALTPSGAPPVGLAGHRLPTRAS